MLHARYKLHRDGCPPPETMPIDLFYFHYTVLTAEPTSIYLPWQPHFACAMFDLSFQPPRHASEYFRVDAFRLSEPRYFLLRLHFSTAKIIFICCLE